MEKISLITYAPRTSQWILYSVDYEKAIFKSLDLEEVLATQQLYDAGRLAAPTKEDDNEQTESSE